MCKSPTVGRLDLCTSEITVAVWARRDWRSTFGNLFRKQCNLETPLSGKQKGENIAQKEHQMKKFALVKAHSSTLHTIGVTAD